MTTTAEAPARIAAESATPSVEIASDAPAEVAHLLQGDETVLLLLKPSLLFIPLSTLSFLLSVAVLSFLLAWLDQRFPQHIPWRDDQVIALGIVVCVLRLLWQFLEWANRVYILTDRRVIRRRGVIRVNVFECRLENLQQTAVFQSLRERLFFLGTLCFATAGAARFIALWEYVKDPFDVQRTVAEAVERYVKK
jgi:uncharacterized membrane protein YdbT with pleckstrin-like domain